MQNQLQYPSNFSSQQPQNPLTQQKFNSPSHLKSFDKTLPNMNVKHYASNPNLSLEVNGLKTSGIINDSQPYSPTIKKST